ncbi:hypothetical protein PV327_001913 [Microctonus hyperodae]|uniref:G-patch domain-containing protein n=1 Tax=Microctonus hyperodae TaxID=165561 RepID=A0AA39FEG6_MICHY|nr:hypothetical protein PV327_001913 [Microctonus hyperodae]
MSDEDDDNFVIIGEALEPLDEDNLPRKKPVTIEDQYALDAQGRRRFHGAFTGGFSAGYFNSVGTRDGWRPHQFKSSRSKKAENISQRPEDFMDDEDTGEFGIAPIGIRATSDFSNHNERGIKRGRPRIDDNGPIPGTPVLRELLRPVTDTVGVKLLKKMGWKPGQGVGPRITKREKNKTRKKNIGLKVYGCSLPNTEMKIPETHFVSSDDDDEETFFAPDDFEPFRCNPKDNYFGIGYSGLNKLSSLSGHINLIDAPAFQMQDKNKKLSIRGQAFGVGAFEADDDDIYERDDMSRYDFTLGPETKKNNRKAKSSGFESLSCKHLEGFVLAETRLERKKLFSPPKLSENFKPIHVIRKSRFSPETNEGEITNKLHWKNQTRPNLNAQDREKILNDYNQFNNNSNSDQSNSNRESLMKLDQNIEISPVSSTNISKTMGTIDGSESADNEKSISKPSWMDKLTIKSFVSGGIEGPSKQNSQDSTTSSESNVTSILNETCDSKTSNQNKLNSIPDLVKPFIHDKEKQSRFEKFLEFSTGEEKEKLEHIQPLSMDKWERQREFEEFKMVAKSFKQINISQNEKSETECKTVHNLSSDDCAMNAAKMKMFGKFTRTIDIWRPASAVCKRFNISEPKSGCAQPDSEKVKKYRLFESLDFSDGIGASDIKFQKAVDNISNDNEYRNEKASAPNHSSIKNHIKLLDTHADHKIVNESIDSIPNTDIKKSESDFKKDNKLAEGNESCLSDIQVNVNPEAKADLFKAIFLSSSEASDSDDEPSEDINSETVKSLLIGKSANELNTQRNTSPARGIFAQLNLDDMIRSNEKTDDKDTDDVKMIQTVNKNSSTSNTIDIESEVEIPKDIYGPALPIKLESSHKQSSCNQSNSEKLTFKSVIVSKLNNLGKSSKWVEKFQEKKSKKAKKKHKQKEKRKDRKHKHKSKRKKID